MKKNNNKLTKRHYNRKLLVFGVILFLSIALVSTGFAAWVISNGAETTDTGNVNVGKIEDGGLTFTDIEFDTVTGNTIMFEPAKDDMSGDIKWDADAPEEYENLSIKFTTTLYPKSFVKNVQLKLEVPAGVQAAADAGYIVLPAAVKSDGTFTTVIERNASQALEVVAVDGVTVTFEDDSKTQGIKITCTIQILWGAIFGNTGVTETSTNDGTINPSIYLDTAKDAEGKFKYDFDEKMSIMSNFRKTIYQYPDAPAEFGTAELAQYTIDVCNLTPTEFAAKYPNIYTATETEYTITIYAEAL